MNRGLLVTLLFVTLGLVAVFAYVLNQPSDFSSDNPSFVRQVSGKKIPEFSFSMAENQFFTNTDLENHWTLFFVGYTFCPDVCPSTLADLDRIYPELTIAPYDNIQIVFISVDPNRDKANNLAEYVNYFNPNFKGVTSSHSLLFPFVQNLGLIYSIVEAGDSKEAYYLVDHSASLVLISPKGEHYATFKAVLNEDNIAHVDMDLMVKDIHKIIDKDAN